MGVISKMRKQSAVWWSRTGTDKMGQPTWGSPVQIACRWEDVQQAQKTEAIETEMEMGTVYVDRDMKPGDKLMLGALTSSTSHDPQQVGAWEVQKFEKLPNFKVTDYLRTCTLVR